MAPIYYPDSVVAIGSLKHGSARGSQVWSPLNLGTAGVAWWDASDANTVTLNQTTVSGWTSKIGSAVVSQPTFLNQPIYKLAQINGRNTVNGSNQTAFLIGGNVAVNIQNCGVIAFFNFPSPNNQEIVGSDPAGSHRLDLAVNATTGTLFYFAGNGNQSVGGNLFNAGHIAGLWISGGTVTPRIDGTALATSTCPANTTTSIGIGSFAQSATGPFMGDIGDVLYMASPSLNQFQKAEGYLAWKWNVVANLPAGHPYKTRPPLATDPN